MENFIVTYSISASNLTETLALLTEIEQRTGVSPSTIRLQDGLLIAWNKSLALKVATGRLDPQHYIDACIVVAD
jgi:hypothetical protein